jgi:myosin heavy subunit
MAQEKVVKLKVESNLKQVTDQLEKLNEQVDAQEGTLKDTNDAVKNLEKSTTKYAKKSTKDFKKVNDEVSELDKNLKKANQGFRAGSEVIGFVGESLEFVGVESEAVEENLRSVDEAMRLGKGVEGVLGATKSIKDLGLATKITAGLQSLFTTAVGTSSGALKAFRIALVSTGIGAIVVGLGLLIANFEKVQEAITGGIEGFKEMGIGMKLLMIPLLPLIAAIDAVTWGLQKLGIVESDREKASRKRNEQLLEEYKKEKRAIEDNISATKKYQKAQQDRYDKQIELLEAEGKETRKIEELKVRLNVQTQKQILKDKIKAFKLAQKSTTRFGKINAKLQLEAQKERLKEAQFEELKFDLETNKIKSDNYKDYSKNRLNAQRELQDLQLQAELTALETEQRLLKAKGDEFEEERLAKEQEIFEKEIEIQRINFQREYDDVLKNENLTTTEKNAIRKAKEEEWNATEKQLRTERYAEELENLQDQLEKEDELRDKANEERIKKEDAIFDLELKLMKDRELAEIIELTASYDKKFELAVDNAELEKQLEDQLGKDIEAIREKYRKMDEEADKKALQGKIDNATAQVNVGIDALRLLGDIAEATAGDDVARQKKAFKIKKAGDIASATMDGFKAVLSAYASTAGGPVIKGIAGAIAGAFAGLQIANIAKQKFEGGAGDVESSSKAGGGGDIITPEFNIVGGEELTDLEGVGQQPLQAYVVSGDVTSAQSLDRNRVENATF